MVYLCTSNIYTLINYTAFVESTFILISIASLLYLRWKRPDIERPIKVSFQIHTCIRPVHGQAFYSCKLFNINFNTAIIAKLEEVCKKIRRSPLHKYLDIMLEHTFLSLGKQVVFVFNEVKKFFFVNLTVVVVISLEIAKISSK